MQNMWYFLVFLVTFILKKLLMQEIVLSMDLVKAAQQLRFIAAVGSTHCLKDGTTLDRAIYR